MLPKFTPFLVRFLCSLVPRVCDVILEVCSVQDLTSDQYLGDELMFNMLLLSEVLCIPGKPCIIYHKSEERYFNLKESLFVNFKCADAEQGYSTLE